MTIEIGLILSAFSLIIAFLGYQLSKQKQQFEHQKDVKTDTRKNTEHDVRLQTQLDYISKGVDDIRIDLKANEKRMNELGERVTRVEESAKQAHKRIDNIKKEEIKDV